MQVINGETQWPFFYSLIIVSVRVCSKKTAACFYETLGLSLSQRSARRKLWGLADEDCKKSHPLFLGGQESRITVYLGL